MKAKIYLAGPLFSQAEIEWAGQLKGRIEEELGDKVEVVWPHQIAAKVAAQSSREIFLSNLAHLEQCPLMVAILDGSQVDDGTAWEVGYHHALFGPLSRIGIRTDFRRAGETDESKVNAMIEESCCSIVDNPDDLIRELEEALKDIGA